ncbi:hypothetical protein Tco_0413360 [Tanacetum coccineum]
MGRSRIGGQPPGESDVHGPDRKGLFSLSMALAEPYLAGAEATATQIKNELRNKTLALERVQRHSGPTTIQVMSDSDRLGINKARDIVMSDSKDSTVTYTTVSSPFGGLSYIRSPGVDGPPVMLEDPYAYVVAAFQAPTSPDYVSGPKYLPLPEFVPEAVYL